MYENIPNSINCNNFNSAICCTAILSFFLAFHQLCTADNVYAQEAVQNTAKEIIFLAGPKDHGMPGRHEYEKDLQVLAKSLEASSNIKNITTKIYTGEAPKDLSIYQNAAAIVINSSSDRLESELHPLFPPNQHTNGVEYEEDHEQFLRELKELVNRNQIGMAVFHYASWVENRTARDYYMEWFGGLWVQGVSVNPVATWDMELNNNNHPVLNGVSPWRYRDEIFSRYFLPDHLPGRTELLVAHPDPDPTLEARRLPDHYGYQTASWVYERQDGGRSFVFGGMDFHDNMEIEDYRRFVLNGIVWIAGMDVPAGGVDSPTPANND